MSPDESRDKLNTFMDAFGAVLEKYEEHNPAWMETTLLQILHGAIEDLRDLVEKDAEAMGTWDPIVELRYPVQADWEKVEPVYFRVEAADLEDAKRAGTALIGGFIAVRDVFILRHLTRDVLIVVKNGKAAYKVPVELDKKLAKLPRKEQVRRIEKILTLPTKITRIGPLYDLPARGKRRARAYLVIHFRPCVLDLDEKLAYYPIIIGLEFTGIPAKDVDKETRAELFKGLLEGIEAAIPAEDLAFLTGPRPEPTARPVTKETPLVKASLHTELQKFGHKPDPKQPGLFDKLLDDTGKDIESKAVDVIGIDITPAQEQALHALQTLLTRTSYKGNRPGEIIDDKAFKFKGYLPALEFSPVKYLEAYGLKKRLTGRGQEEYSPKDRAEALHALVELATKRFLLVYKTEYWKENPTTKKKELRVDRVETTDTLIKIMRGWEALTKKEDASLDQGTHTRATDDKLRTIAIKPAPILVQDIDSYFLLKPADYLQEINLRYPWPNRPSRFTIRLINWLITQAELKRRHKQPLTVEVSLETIAYALRMDAFIKTRQFKRIRDIITKGYKISQELGYLLSYSTVQGQTKELERLELNPEKFSKVREPEDRGQAGGKDIAS